MYVRMFVCVCVCVCIYVRFQSKCVPSQQWCFSESPPPLVEWGLPDAETCTVACPSRQLDRYKLPHQDATLAQCPAAPYTDRPSPLAAAWSTCSCNQYGSSTFIKHITVGLFRYCATRRHVEGECLPTFRTVTVHSEHGAPLTQWHSRTFWTAGSISNARYDSKKVNNHIDLAEMDTVRHGYLTALLWHDQTYHNSRNWVQGFSFISI
jgi:hypothetical protein